MSAHLSFQAVCLNLSGAMQYLVQLYLQVMIAVRVVVGRINPERGLDFFTTTLNDQNQRCCSPLIWTSDQGRGGRE